MNRAASLEKGKTDSDTGLKVGRMHEGFVRTKIFVRRSDGYTEKSENATTRTLHGELVNESARFQGFR